MNIIFTIAPYVYKGQWVFDDPAKGLVREAFVGGSDDILDVATRNIPDANKGFLALFSTVEFPGAQIHLEWVRKELSGNVYIWRDKKMEGWLCPALLKYFDTPPKDIWVQVKPLKPCTGEVLK